MESNEKLPPDLNDVDFTEEIDDDELQELVLEAQREALIKEAHEKTYRITKHPFPKWLFWLISIVMVFNTFAVIFEVYSIPAIEFLKTSSKLSKQENIATFKKSVVVIQSAESKGTGFSISNDGTILTNYHVIKGSDKVNVYFPEEGRFTADVVHTYPSVDLAILKVNSQNLPYLKLAKKTSFTANEAINFIGNPLSFKGIANEGTIIDIIQLPDWDVPVVMMKAPVYRGNSGSPVLNSKGLVIGIVFATLDHETYGKVGLFIPIDEFYNQQ